MLARFEKDTALDVKLSEYNDDRLNRLYLQVFNTDDGHLVLKDLANRCFADIPTSNDREVGMRCAYLSIMTRLRKSVVKRGGNDEDS